MFSKEIFLTLLFLIAINYCHSEHQLSKECQRLHELNNNNSKPAECHYPFIDENKQWVYMQSLEPKPNYRIIAWYYEPAIGSCRPLYAYHNYNTCPCNEDISKQKKVCEKLCGHPCLVRDDDEPGQTLPGVCMDPKFCALPKSDIDPTVCSKYGNAKCCRRDLEYVYPGYTSDGSSPKEETTDY